MWAKPLLVKNDRTCIVLYSINHAFRYHYVSHKFIIEKFVHTFCKVFKNPMVGFISYEITDNIFKMVTIVTELNI